MSLCSFFKKFFIYVFSWCLSVIIREPLIASAGFACLSKCTCIYKSNKQIADCGGIGFTKLPEGSDQRERLEAIQVLNLTRNNFVELQNNVFFNTGLINLQRLYLKKAGLEKIEDNAFYRLTNLVELDLSWNSLKFVSTNAFIPIPKLRELDLGYNKIDHIPSDSFVSLSQLRFLSLEKNNINSLDDGAFNGLIQLEDLKLNDNQLNFLSSSLLVPLIKLNTVTLNGNKWRCDCRMRQLREYLLMTPRINVRDRPKCNVNGKRWTDLGLDSFLCAPKIYKYSDTPFYQVEQGKDLELKCTFLLEDGLEYQPMGIKWYWQNRPITNNSEGVVETQLFKINQYDTVSSDAHQKRKVRVSRLQVSYVLELNSGLYWCEARNNVGLAVENFTVTVASPQPKPKVSAAAASVETEKSQILMNKNESDLKSANRVVIGLVLGILFGIFLVLVLFGIGVVVLCRRRQHKRRNSSTNRVVAADSELEKLTTSSIGSNPSTNIATLVNPVQKPPRLGFSSSPTMPTGMVFIMPENNRFSGIEL